MHASPTMCMHTLHMLWCLMHRSDLKKLQKQVLRKQNAWHQQVESLPRLTAVLGSHLPPPARPPPQVGAAAALLTFSAMYCTPQLPQQQFAVAIGCSSCAWIHFLQQSMQIGPMHASNGACMATTACMRVSACMWRFACMQTWNRLPCLPVVFAPHATRFPAAPGELAPSRARCSQKVVPGIRCGPLEGGGCRPCGCRHHLLCRSCWCPQL